MLFISRRVGYSGYGVVDTDDGVEEIVTGTALYDVPSELRKSIKGVLENTEAAPQKAFRPWQDPDSRSLLQTKTSTLHNVDVTVWGDMVTDIVMRNTQIEVIRLSDFGTRCADCVFVGNNRPKRHRLTLILDDKVELNLLSFKILQFADKYVNAGVSSIGVVFDLREVRKRLRTREVVYHSLFESDPQLLKTSIIDEEGYKNDMLRKAFSGRLKRK